MDGRQSGACHSLSWGLLWCSRPKPELLPQEPGMKLRGLQASSGVLSEDCVLTSKLTLQAKVRGTAEGAGHPAAEGSGIPGRHCEADGGLRGGGHGCGGAGSCHCVSSNSLHRMHES